MKKIGKTWVVSWIVLMLGSLCSCPSGSTQKMLFLHGTGDVSFLLKLKSACFNEKKFATVTPCGGSLYGVQ